MSKKIIIAIDGFSSCGKSTLAKALAKELSYVFIDTGAMYRAVALYFMRHSIPFDDIIAIEKAIQSIKLHFVFNEGTGKSDMYLNGENVESIQPGTVRDCREFFNKYKDIEGFEIYGQDRYVYQYISEMYPEEEIKFDTNKIKISTIDIEVASENGFPDVESAAEEVLLITVQDYSSKQIHTWGKGPFQNNQNNVKYRSFSTKKTS